MGNGRDGPESGLTELNVEVYASVLYTNFWWVNGKEGRKEESAEICLGHFFYVPNINETIRVQITSVISILGLLSL